MRSERPCLARRGIAMMLVAAGAMAVLSAKRAEVIQSDVARRQTAATPNRVLAWLDAADRHLDYVPGEVLVKFKDGVTTTGQQRALMALRSRPSVGDLRWTGPVAVVTDLGQPDARILASQLASQPEVEYAEPNYLMRIPRANARFAAAATPPSSRPLGVPSDPDYNARQWNLIDLDMPRTWDIQPGGSPTITVADVDTGVTTAKQTLTFPLWNGHAFQQTNLAFNVSPDLDASRLTSPFDFAFETSGGPVLDMDGHGTHVSSTIAESTNNNVALAGMAYRVNIMPVKVCIGYWEVMIAMAQAGVQGFAPADAGGCADSDIAKGIRYAADHGARVINLSLGGPDDSQTIRDAIQYAVQHGAFVSISAGNSYEDGNTIEYPAGDAPGIEGAVSVAATGRSRRRAHYSTTGSQVEVAAPGGDDQDGGREGMIWQMTLYYPDQDPSVIAPRFDRYAEIGYEGTSMSAAHVSGLAALIMSQLGSAATPALVERIIETTALDLGAAGKDDEFGYGLIQPRAAVFGVGLRK